MAVGWQHPVDVGDQWDGFNEPGIEHFSGSPTRHLAREVNQNSLDAHDKGQGWPVKVRISKRTVPTSTIPDVDQLRNTFQACVRAAKNESPKARQFFEAGLSELGKPKVTILQIEDYNTRGVAGPSRNGTPFYAFMKAKGQSKKQSDMATGSFGIGKFAPYAVSKLRTVFVSTVYRDSGGVPHQLTQGKSILMSHDIDEQRVQGVGFWGRIAKCQPVEGSTATMPQWLVRCQDPSLYEQSCGTKLTILGFDDKKGWERQLVASVAENFFGAIVAGQLEISIGDAYQLTAETIGDVLTDPELIDAVADQQDEPDQIINSASYLSCLLGGSDVKVEESEMLWLGLCELRLRVATGLPRKVCVLRNGMFISDSLRLPGMKSFSDFKEFVAVLQCKSAKGVELLRAMEPPRHDTFEPDRLSTPEDQERGRKALKDLAKWVRDMLKRHAKDPVTDVTSIDELKDYFAEEGSEPGGKGSEEVNPYGEILLTAKPLPSKKVSPAGHEEEGGDGGSGGSGAGGVEGGGGDGGGDEGELDGEGGGGATVSRPWVALSNPRATIISGARRRISFTPCHTGRVQVTLFEAGADADYRVPISHANTGEIQDGRLLLNVQHNVRAMIEVKLAEEFAGAIKVVAHAL